MTKQIMKTARNAIMMRQKGQGFEENLTITPAIATAIRSAAPKES